MGDSPPLMGHVAMVMLCLSFHFLFLITQEEYISPPLLEGYCKFLLWGMIVGMVCHVYSKAV
jgi:hypothetical protein